MSILNQKVTIYTRFSSEMQRDESCEDQERETRAGLQRLGINHQGALVLEDKAVSGEIADRAEFTRLIAMIKRGQVAVLAVDSQSRLTRAGASDAYAIVKDIVFHGGRFISVSEGIDTARDDWDLLVQVKGLTHGAENRDKAKAVHRGQKGRAAKPDASVGDYTFGFRTATDDPAWTYSKESPRPKKHNVIEVTEAGWVVEAFKWFTVKMWSISKITRELNRLEVPKGHRSSKPGWHHEQVRRMLTNTKYIGKWTWGTTRVVRDSRGKKKQIAVPASDAVVTLRPELRIIDDETWNKAQKRLAELKQVYGHKDGQRPRGPRTHHTSVYPTSLLGGLLFCGACGARLVYQTGGSGVYYGCSKHRKGTCKQATRVPREKTEKLLSDFLAGEFKGIPEWMTGVIGMLSVHFKELDTRLPQEIQARTRARDQLIKKITNLTEAIENGSGNSASLSSSPKRSRSPSRRHQC